MTASFMRLLRYAFAGSCLLPVVTIVCSQLDAKAAITPPFLLTVSASALIAVLATLTFSVLLRRQAHQLDANAHAQAQFVTEVSERYLNWGIAGAAGLSLLLELAVIRWQASVFEFFAFYKNFTLLCCFAGLGLGYALASRGRLLLGWVIPLLAWQLGLLIALRFGLAPERLDVLRHLPFREQLAMGISGYENPAQATAVYFFLTVVFLLTVLAFLPIGQLCGCWMERRPKLPAYGLNLLGSLAGVVAMLVLSSLWTPPLVWFAIAFGGILLFYLRETRAVALGIAGAGVGLIILAWPVGGLWQRIYSPYQLVEIGYSRQGLMLLRAAGHYFQRVYDLAPANRNVETDPLLRGVRGYYELPYRVYGSPRHVVIVGAGTGNDVAAALRAGAGSVDAVEIDPAILLAGKANHPEHPYQDRRVRAIVNDARSFLRTTDAVYDMVVYGVLDSHTLLSHASSVRLDSFVYTVEGFREARARLKPGGVLSLSFAVLNDQLSRKIFLTLQQAFDGRPPICLETSSGNVVIFLEAKDRELVLPRQFFSNTGFRDHTQFYANSSLRADVATDDWPFFYMPARVYPVSYFGVGIVLLVLSLILKFNFFNEGIQFGQLPFFLLGAGFMLIETKGVTELGLTFGNSWQVIGIVISGILVMAFLANCVVQWLGLRRPLIPYLLLILTLGLGWAFAHGGGLPSTPLGRVGTVVLLTGPIFFSGIVFSTLVASRGTMASIMGINLLGAMLGGMLEYNSMYFGFQFLYLLAIALYTLGLLWELLPRPVPAPAIVGGS